MMTAVLKEVWRTQLRGTDPTILGVSCDDNSWLRARIYCKFKLNCYEWQRESVDPRSKSFDLGRLDNPA